MLSMKSVIDCVVTSEKKCKTYEICSLKCVDFKTACHNLARDILVRIPDT